MHRFESIDLGTYRGHEYLLVGFVDPDPRGRDRYDPDEHADAYGVTIARSVATPHAETVEVVRMDTAHGRPHLDRCYLPPDADRKRWLSEGYSYERMKRYLLAHWRSFADRELARSV